MCGIFAHFSNSAYDKQKCIHMANRCAHRGPDNTQNVNLGTGCMIFHRLAVNDLSQSGNQPFAIIHPDCQNLNDIAPKYIYAMCNGEIYNSKQLISDYQLPVASNSDCEVIPHLYAKVGIEQCIKLLDGYFAIVIYDQYNQRVYVARDRFGVRSLYIDFVEGNELTVASEMKSLINNYDCKSESRPILQFPPRSIYEFAITTEDNVQSGISLVNSIIYYQLPSHWGTCSN